MLQRIPDVPDGIDALAAIGTLTRQDYEQSIEPILDEARRSSRRIRLLVQLGPEYEGYTAGAAWEKTANAFRSPSLLDCSTATRSSPTFTGCTNGPTSWGSCCPSRCACSATTNATQAIAWLSALPEGPGVAHHLVPESGVLVVEVTAPLRAQDFDALAATADTWLETHDALPGVVIHARQFPGWENAASMLRHLRFVRDHHRAVRRVALAADGKQADLIAGLAEHFVHAEIKRFGYDDLDEAVAWAAGPATEHAAVAAVGTSEPVTS